MSVIRILGISGSLRANSSNTTLLRAAARLAWSRDMSITIYARIGELPISIPSSKELNRRQ